MGTFLRSEKPFLHSDCCADTGWHLDCRITHLIKGRKLKVYRFVRTSKEMDLSHIPSG